MLEIKNYRCLVIWNEATNKYYHTFCKSKLSFKYLTISLRGQNLKEIKELKRNLKIENK